MMQRGRIEEAGQARAVLERPRSAYTRTLLSAVSRIAGAVQALSPTH